MSSKWSISLKFPHKNHASTPPLPHKCHEPGSSHPSWFDHPNTIPWGAQIVAYSSSLYTHFHSPVTSSLLRQVSSSSYCSLTPSTHAPSSVWKTKFHEGKKYRQYYSSVYINLCRSQWSWPLACWDCGFKSHRGDGCLLIMSVVCCQVEVSATSWSLAQRSPSDCGASFCVIQKPREWGVPGPLGALAPKTNIC